MSLIDNVVNSNEKSIQDTLQQVYEFKNKVTTDMIENQKRLTNKITDLNSKVLTEKEKVHTL